MEPPTPEDVRQALAHFDARQQKIVAGLFAVMVRESTRVRDREWITQQLTEITVLAGEFEAESAQAGIQIVQDYLRANAQEILNGAFMLFQRVGLDLAPRAKEGFGFEEALQLGLNYLPPSPPEPPEPSESSE